MEKEYEQNNMNDNRIDIHLGFIHILSDMCISKKDHYKDLKLVPDLLGLLFHHFEIDVQKKLTAEQAKELKHYLFSHGLHLHPDTPVYAKLAGHILSLFFHNYKYLDEYKEYYNLRLEKYVEMTVDEFSIIKSTPLTAKKLKIS